MKTKINKAIKLFEAFTGHRAKFIDHYKKPEFPDVALKIGKCTGIMYETIRDGKKEKYLHQFEGKETPILICSYDGKKIFLLGGKYFFNASGINDK